MTNRRSALAIAGVLTVGVIGGLVATRDEAPADSESKERVVNPGKELPVQEAHLELATGARNVTELATKGVVAVRAVATAKSQESAPQDPELVYTLQEFETVETYWGKVDPTFTVFFTGGIVEGPDGPYLLQVPEDPQFVEGAEYLLVLMPRPTYVGQFFTMGGSQGRYEIVDGRLDAVPAAHGSIERQLDGLSLPDAVGLLKAARQS